ncbi:type IV pilus inner membrane component PilO [Glaciibacter psychrotolerans]|uniref:Tfp pilus assembly protein PilO n=1 Tax=Glaciibacter psychrotolerans TaxID=670054 RepID=A0A7Z0EHD1_9MICO|nr:hypothetical protein [Leifsonia psychrotolerans]NYJ21541.1 Tfp pilus assembly protein PilO [Leifsonia psychrotolerans]
MDKNRMWAIGSILLMAALVVGGWFLAVQPQLALAQVATMQRATVEATNATHAAGLEKLKKDFANIETLKQELAPLDASVPTDTEVPAFLEQLDAMTSAALVRLDSVTMSDPQPYTPVVPVEAPVAAGTEAAPAPIDGVDAVPAAPAAGAPPVTNSLITASNFASLPVQINVSGSYDSVLNFVKGLQSGTRLFMATGLTTATDTSTPGSVTATVSGLIYVLVPTDVSAGTDAPPATGTAEASGN